MDSAATAHALFDALGEGDFERFASFFAKGAVMWHNTRGREQSVAETIARLKASRTVAPKQSYEERRYVSIPGGALCQHTLRLQTAAGTPVVMHLMLRIAMDEAGISRIDEYYDSAQSKPLIEEMQRQ